MIGRIITTINFITKGHLVNKQKSQSGFAHHLIIIIAIVAVVIGALGYVYWKNFMQPKVTADAIASITKSDGTTVTTKLDAEGKTITVTTTPDGTSTTAKSDGTVVVEKVNTDGTVTATETKSDGTTNTTVKQAVSAPGVPDLSVTGMGASSIAIGFQFTISGVSGAEGYEVFKSTNSGEFTLYDRITASPIGANAVISVSVYRGETCEYKVRAYKKDGEAFVYSNFSASQTKTNSTNPLVVPTISIAGFGAEGSSYSLLLSLATSDTVFDGFQVFRSTSGISGEYALLEQLNSPNNEISVTIPNGDNYHYKIRTFATDGETTLYSSFSDVTASQN